MLQRIVSGSAHGIYFQENWNSSNPLPDMRLLIIEPTILKEESLTRLQDVGWGLCRVPRMEYLKVFRCEEALKFWVPSTKKKCQGLFLMPEKLTMKNFI